MPSNGYQSPATRLAARVQAVEATDVTQNAALEGGPGGLPFCDSDHVTGTFTTTSTEYTPLLRANAGAPVEVTVTDPPVGTKARVTISGTMNNGLVQDGGPSDQVFIRPVVNGVSYDDGFLGGCYCQGGQRMPVTGEWVIPLTVTSAIRLELRTLSGNLVACYPNDPQGDYLRTSVKLTVQLCS